MSTPGRLPRPAVLAALLAGVLVATAGWAWMFRRAAGPRPVDPLLGALVEVRFEADLPWKRSFAPEGAALRLESVLRVKVEGTEDAGPRRHLRLRILDRGGQDPYALTDFRWGILRGQKVTIQDETSLLEVEVVDVKAAKGP